MSFKSEQMYKLFMYLYDILMFSNHPIVSRNSTFFNGKAFRLNVNVGVELRLSKWGNGCTIKLRLSLFIGHPSINRLPRFGSRFDHFSAAG